MIRESLIRYSLFNTFIEPHFLDERDYSWLRSLIQEYQRFIGRPRHELTKRWKEPLSFFTPEHKRALALYTLNKASPDSVGSPVSPKLIRTRVFTVASQNFPRLHRENKLCKVESLRKAILEQVAQELKLSKDTVERLLFADLPHERIVGNFNETMTPERLALKANLLMVQGIISRATNVAIQVFGGVRPLVRHAKFRGLICTAQSNPENQGSLLKISGPLSLFRLTLMYGRHLAELVPILGWTNDFDLLADCVLNGKAYQFRLQPGAPIAKSKAPALFDSKVEEQFYEDFQKGALDWDIVRESEPACAHGTLIFPDFQIKKRSDPSQSWFIEIIGFWTPEYLSNKLQKLKEARLKKIILCVDATKNCSDSDFPDGALVIRYKRRIKLADVFAKINGAEDF